MPDPLPLSPAELGRLADLEAKASPPPWTHARLALDEGGTVEKYVARCVSAGSGPFYFGLIEKPDGPADAYHTGNGPCSAANSALIAELRNALPRLLAELLASRAAVAPLNIETFNKLVRVYEDAEDALAMRQALTDLAHFVISHREAIRSMSAAVAQARAGALEEAAKACDAAAEKYAALAAESERIGERGDQWDAETSENQSRANASAIRALAHGAPDAG